MSETGGITVAWLHSIKPDKWERRARGIDYANWSINSIQSRPRNVPVDDYHGYDIGPFVWSVAPSHTANMVVLEKPCNANFTILVLESREDVLKLLDLIEKQEQP